MMKESEKMTIIELSDRIEDNIRRLKCFDKKCDYGLKEHSNKISNILNEFKILGPSSIRERVFKVLDDEISIAKRIINNSFDCGEFINHAENIRDGIKFYGIKGKL